MVGESTFEWLSKTRIGIFLFGFLLTTTMLSGQHYLEGHWEGTLSEYDSNGTKTTKEIELFLEKEGDQISGRFFVRLAPGEIMATEIFGYMYGDRSIYLTDQKYLGPNLERQPEFYRKYQLLPNRSIWKTTLEGYWQEIVSGDPLHKGRKLGKVELRKMDNGKA